MSVSGVGARGLPANLSVAERDSLFQCQSLAAGAAGPKRLAKMPHFRHRFEPPEASPPEITGGWVELTVEEVEQAGVEEIVQTPGAGLGSWSLLTDLVDDSSGLFSFREPLGRAREVKTALSGLFGRFVARAYAKRYLGFAFFAHIDADEMSLTPTGGVVRKFGTGDRPDWAVWNDAGDMAIIEAKGCHDGAGPQAALNRAWDQVQRGWIFSGVDPAPFKRYAIATRWGFSTPGHPQTPMLWVKDTDVEGVEKRQEKLDELAIGIARLHCANLMRGLGYGELAMALRDLTLRTTKAWQADHEAAAIQALDAVRGANLGGGEDAVGPDMIGGVVTPGGPTGDRGWTPDLVLALQRLKIRAYFVGLDAKVIEAVIVGDIGQLRELARAMHRADPTQFLWLSTEEGLA